MQGAFDEARAVVEFTRGIRQAKSGQAQRDGIIRAQPCGLPGKSFYFRKFPDRGRQPLPLRRA